MANVESFSKPVEKSELMLMNKIKKQFKKSPSKGGTSQRAFSAGATVHVLSGPFEDFIGSILEVNLKNKKVGQLDINLSKLVVRLFSNAFWYCLAI